MTDGHGGSTRRSRVAGLVRRSRVAALIGLFCCAVATPAWGLGALADADAQKAAVKCQALIGKTTAKALATKLKAFNACAAAALACVETKFGKADCPAKATATCTKKLGSAAAAAVKARAKITENKSCLALSETELLGDDGLGFGGIAGTCSADFGIDVCDGLDAIAECLLTSHDVGAGELFGRPAPRTSELLGLLPGAPLPNTGGLSPTNGCGSCNVQTDKRKSVEKCGKALSAGTAALASALEGAFGKCTGELYECAQAKAGAADCVAAATTACTKASVKVTKAVAKLGAVATKGCGVDFANASEPGGLNLTALAGRCADLGVATLADPTALATCLAAEARCAIATLVSTSLPRTAEFSSAELGALAADLQATCPAVSSLQKARIATAPRAVFGSILKLLKGVKRSVPNALGVRASGGKPSPSGNSGAGVSKVTGPKKVTFGGIGKYKVTYHGPRSRIGGGPANDAPPPTMIVTVTRPDIVLDDHFELPLLTVPGNGSDLEDEIEVEFSDTIPACAFALSFATQSTDGVSDYESIPQVLDGQDPVVATLELASRATGGEQQDGAADGANIAVSADGRYVAFSTRATNLRTPPDANGTADVYVRDRCVANGAPVDGCTPSTTMESVGPGNEPFHDGAEGHVGISDDGRFVAYSVFRNADPNPPIVQSFVKDRCVSNGQPVDSCTVVNEDATFDGESLTSGGTLTSFSSDGRFVVFTSSTSFGPGLPRVFLLDRCVSTFDPVYPGCEPFLNRVSDSHGGGSPNGASDFGAVSRNGRYVAYRSDGSDILLGGEDTNGANDVFLHDTCLDPATGLDAPGCTRSTIRVNLGIASSQSVGDDAVDPPLTNVAVSDDGRYVAFTSTASDLLGAGVDTNGKRDVFVYDRCVADGIPVDGCAHGTERVNVGPGGTESNGDIPGGFALSMSANGRLVAFATDATNLQGPAVGAPNGTFQIFLRDRCVDKGVAVPGCTPATTLVSAAPDKGLGTGISSHPALAANGATTGFVSAAPNLLGAGVDANNLTDVFVRDR